MHIGLIGGIGPAATEFYYRGLIARHAKSGTKSGTALDLTIVHADVSELARNLANGDARKQADVFLHLVRRLAAAGAEVAAVSSMGGHFCIRELEAISPLPIVNAIPEVDAAIARRQLKTVGILGTRTVMETRLYGGISSASVVLPQGAALDRVHTSYIELALAGRVTDAQRDALFSAGRALCRDQGADAVLLGGTDLFLAFDGRDCGFPVVDCAEIHIEMLFQLSLRGRA
jgi:aspartate racemase